MVNQAVVVRSQKRTGRGFENIVAIFVNPKLVFYKIRLFHALCFGNAFNIFNGDERLQSLAAIGTLQAVYLVENLIVQSMNNII